MNTDDTFLKQRLKSLGLDMSALKKFKLFEFGKSYHLFDSYIENQHLFLSFTGLKHQENWNSNKESIDFYYVKEYVHTLLKRLNISKFKSKECSCFGLSQAMIYSYKGKNLVEFGSVDQNILDKFKKRALNNQRPNF